MYTITHNRERKIILEEIHKNIGKNIHRIRKERNLSLDKVAEITGVSKAMLGQIERGESNPTVTTLWKIANGFHVSFSSLIEEEVPPVSVINVASINPLEEEEGEYRVYPLFPFDSSKRFEIFSIHLEPGCTHESEAHHKGVEEYVIVSQGELDIILNQISYNVEQGNAIHFVADQPHIYRNPTSFPAHYTILIYYPGI
jgi:transcriptional regulator with XRE-family HTH domain